MLTILSRFLGKKAKEEVVATPAPGEKWIYKGRDGSPWARAGYHPVDILDVKDGWVRYDMGPLGPFRDERLTIAHFINLYQRVQDT